MFSLSSFLQPSRGLARRSVMPRAFLFTLLALLGILLFTSFNLNHLQRLAQSFAEEQPWTEARAEGAGGEEFAEEAGARLRQNWFYAQRAYPADEVPQGALQHANEQLDEIEAAQLAQRRAGKITAADQQATQSWQSLGPRPIVNGQTFGTTKLPVSGRITCLALDPRYNGTTNQTVYLGAAQGGVWRSTDNGANWTPITDGLPSLAIGAIAIDPRNPNIIWVGTGEANRSGDAYYGAGLFKSTDGGQTWSQIVGPISTTEPRQPVFLNATVARIAIHPTDSNTVFVATNSGFYYAESPAPRTAPLGNRGMWRTTDGGQTWINVNPAVTHLNRAASDVVIDPRNPKRVYVAMVGEGIYVSNDNGSLLSWQLLTKDLPPRTDKEGNPTFLRIALALGPPINTGQPSILYAAFASPYDDLVGIYRSSDGGAAWLKLTSPQSGQTNYNFPLAVDPVNGNIVYYGTSANSTYTGGVVYRSTNGGMAWTDITTSPTGGLHPDAHAVVISPANHNIMFHANDGGVWRTDNALAPAGEQVQAQADTNALRWVNLNSTLNITQFHSVAVHPYDYRLVIGGTQDNGTNAYFGQQSWLQIDFGDGGYTLIDQSNPEVLYHTYYNLTDYGTGALIGPAVLGDNGSTKWDFRGCFQCKATKGMIHPNDRVAFYAPMVANTGYKGLNGNGVYFGTHRVYRTMDRGMTWYGIGPSADGFGSDVTRTKGVVSALASYPSVGATDPNGEIVWTGSSDGRLMVTNNAHLLEKARWFDISLGLPNRYVADIGLDAHNVRRAAAIFSGFGSTTPQNPGHVFLTESFGASWVDITGNLPDVPTNSVVLDPRNNNTMYVGNDLGVFVTTDRGKNWVRMGNGLPRVAVLQLRYHTATGSLVAATHGRGVYRIPVNPVDVSTVSAASYSGSTLTPEGIVSSFGTNLAPRTETARTTPLPTELAGTRVLVRDFAGVERTAPLFFVSPGQVNFLLPLGTAPGEATITIINGTLNKSAVSYINVNVVAPNLFTANASGMGAPAGYALRVRADKTQVTEPLAQYVNGAWQLLPVDLSNANEQVYLVLFGTGFRYNSGLSATNATLSGADANGNPITMQTTVSFAGAQGRLVGLDQLNLRLPTGTSATGEVELTFKAEGRRANAVRLRVR